jgi:membrane protein CcdC involved in cytochrome C biogenesis
VLVIVILNLLIFIVISMEEVIDSLESKMLVGSFFIIVHSMIYDKVTQSIEEKN